MKKWIKRVGIIVVCLTLLIIAANLWTWLKYEKHIISTPERITFTLPFTAENNPQSIIPLGEKEVHNFGIGHGGIDFQWDHSVPLIAVMDGRVSVRKNEDIGEPTWDVNLTGQGFTVIYLELQRDQPVVKDGAYVKKGDFIGYPHGHYFSDSGGHTNYQVQWELRYDTFFPWVYPLCPLTYFDSEARSRIEKLWASFDDGSEFRRKYPDICSGGYYGRDQ